jgi:hypothetical protein
MRFFWDFVIFHCLICLNIKVLLKKFDWTIIGGGTIVPLSPKNKENINFFKLGQIFQLK